MSADQSVSSHVSSTSNLMSPNIYDPNMSTSFSDYKPYTSLSSSEQAKNLSSPVTSNNEIMTDDKTIEKATPKSILKKMIDTSGLDTRAKNEAHLTLNYLMTLVSQDPSQNIPILNDAISLSRVQPSAMALGIITSILLNKIPSCQLMYTYICGNCSVCDIAFLNDTTEELFLGSCGHIYHRTCAQSIPNCKNCDLAFKSVNIQKISATADADGEMGKPKTKKPTKSSKKPLTQSNTVDPVVIPSDQTQPLQQVEVHVHPPTEHSNSLPNVDSMALDSPPTLPPPTPTHQPSPIEMLQAIPPIDDSVVKRTTSKKIAQLLIETSSENVKGLDLVTLIKNYNDISNVRSMNETLFKNVETTKHILRELIRMVSGHSNRVSVSAFDIGFVFKSYVNQLASQSANKITQDVIWNTTFQPFLKISYGKAQQYIRYYQLISTKGLDRFVYGVTQDWVSINKAMQYDSLSTELFVHSATFK